MPKLRKAANREKDQQKKKHGMRRSGDSVKTLRNIILRKAEKASKNKGVVREGKE